MPYDAIVVGAGPTNSTAACILAREGASVLLLDRARFPRDNPYGGGSQTSNRYGSSATMSWLSIIVPGWKMSRRAL